MPDTTDTPANATGGRMGTTDTVSAAHREHLNHLTDGRWHDDCRWCLRRRVHGGTGLEDCTRKDCYAHP